MDKIISMLQKNNRDKIYYRQQGNQIDAAACAVREVALIDALVALGHDRKDIKKRIVK